MRIPSFGHMTQWDTPGMRPFLENCGTRSRWVAHKNIFLGYICNASTYFKNITTLDQSTVNELSLSNESRCINLKIMAPSILRNGRCGRSGQCKCGTTGPVAHFSQTGGPLHPHWPTSPTGNNTCQRKTLGPTKFTKYAVAEHVISHNT